MMILSPFVKKILFEIKLFFAERDLNKLYYRISELEDEVYRLEEENLDLKDKISVVLEVLDPAPYTE